MTKIVQIVNTCRECPNRHYWIGGLYECMKVQDVALPKDGSIPAWCPLADYPTGGWEPVVVDGRTEEEWCQEACRIGAYDYVEVRKGVKGRCIRTFTGERTPEKITATIHRLKVQAARYDSAHGVSVGTIGHVAPPGFGPMTDAARGVPAAGLRLTDEQVSAEWMRWNLPGNDAALAFHEMPIFDQVKRAFQDGLRRGAAFGVQGNSGPRGVKASHTDQGEQA